MPECYLLSLYLNENKTTIDGQVSHFLVVYDAICM